MMDRLLWSERGMFVFVTRIDFLGALAVGNRSEASFLLALLGGLMAEW